MIFIVVRTLRNIVRAFSSNNSGKTESRFKKKEQQSSIKKEDIIEAEFEDITKSESDKSKE